MERNEFKETMSNSVYRKHLIKQTHCGYCGLGKGCNLRGRRTFFSYNKYEYKGVIKEKNKFPSWKLMSKYSKQYQKPKIKKKTIKNQKSRDFFEIYW